MRNAFPGEIVHPGRRCLLRYAEDGLVCPRSANGADYHTSAKTGCHNDTRGAGRLLAPQKIIEADSIRFILLATAFSVNNFCCYLIIIIHKISFVVMFNNIF